MFNFEAFHCGVKCSVSKLLSNRVNLLNPWSLVEESVRHFKSISNRSQKYASTNLSNEIKELEHLFVLLSILHDLEVLIAECEKIMSYLVSQH